MPFDMSDFEWSDDEDIISGEASERAMRHTGTRGNLNSNDERPHNLGSSKPNLFYEGRNINGRPGLPSGYSEHYGELVPQNPDI